MLVHAAVELMCSKSHVLGILRCQVHSLPWRLLSWKTWSPQISRADICGIPALLHLAGMSTLVQLSSLQNMHLLPAEMQHTAPSTP